MDISTKLINFLGKARDCNATEHQKLKPIYLPLLYFKNSKRGQLMLVQNPQWLTVYVSTMLVGIYCALKQLAIFSY